MHGTCTKRPYPNKQHEKCPLLVAGTAYRLHVGKGSCMVTSISDASNKPQQCSRHGGTCVDRNSRGQALRRSRACGSVCCASASARRVRIITTTVGIFQPVPSIMAHISRDLREALGTKSRRPACAAVPMQASRCIMSSTTCLINLLLLFGHRRPSSYPLPSVSIWLARPLVHSSGEWMLLRHFARIIFKSKLSSPNVPTALEGPTSCISWTYNQDIGETHFVHGILTHRGWTLAPKGIENTRALNDVSLLHCHLACHQWEGSLVVIEPI